MGTQSARLVAEALVALAIAAACGGSAGETDGGSGGDPDARVPVEGRWVVTSEPPLLSYRDHAAVLLQDGTVLVTGGQNGQTRVVRYHPQTDSWDVAPSMIVGRDSHTAVVLPDGRVFVAGGYASIGPALDAAEVFDPATNAWSTVAPMPVPRYDHTAFVLTDGRVLVIGGRNGISSTVGKTADIYSPQDDSWTATGETRFLAERASILPLPGARALVVSSNSEIFDEATAMFGDWQFTNGHTNGAAVRLDNDAILAIGGEGDAIATGNAFVDRFDPATNAWTAMAPLTRPRRFHTATALGDGTVLVTGGLNAEDLSDPTLRSAERWDSRTNTWMETPEMPAPFHHHTATLLRDGSVLLIGGLSAVRFVLE